MNRTADRERVVPISGLNFAPAVTYDSGGEYNYSVAVADVNGDGKPDLLVTNFCAGIPNCDGTVGVLLGNGDGTFQEAVTYGSGGFWAYAIAVADVNGDGKQDIVVANLCPISGNCSSGVVGVLLGNGDGTFQAATSYSTGGWVGGCCGSYSLAVADVNGDGKPDLLVASPCQGPDCSESENGTVGVLLGNGDGTFQPVVTYSSGGFSAQGLAVADVNGDGRPDVVVANVCGNSTCTPNNGAVGVLLGNGDGTFQSAVTYSSGGTQANSVAVSDVNGDGKPDLVVVNDSACSDYSCNGNIAVLLGNGNGTFQAPMTYGSGGFAGLSVALADVNGDGKLDAVVAFNSSSRTNNCDGIVAVYLGNGDGSFQSPVSLSSGACGALWVAAADVNADGKPDLLVANECAVSNCSGDGVVSVLINTSLPPTFTTLVSFDFTDGANPLYMSPVQGTDGALYGTTAGGGASPGTVFKITPSGTLTTLHSFGGPDGEDPFAGLLLAIDGYFYGTTYAGGGTADAGTIFKIDSAGSLTTLHIFSDVDGAGPAAALIQGSDGSLYGTTAFGGANGYGTVFKASLDGSVTTLHSFNLTDGSSPYGGLVEGSNGIFYGTTAYGGGKRCGFGLLPGCGTVFKITQEGALTSLHRFGNVDGAFPFSTLVRAPDGSFYGTSTYGGNVPCPNNDGCGTVFRITPAGNLTVLHSFTGSDGANPYAGLIQATDGNFYGTASVGGVSNAGTIFSVSTLGTVTPVYDFTTANGGAVLGGLLQATDGNFYGTTNQGGPQAYGTIFEFSTGLRPFLSFVRSSGRSGQTAQILGQGFTGATSVSFNGIPATFTVRRGTFLTATVPAGATTGYVTVATLSGTLTSNVPFQVLP